MKIAVSFIKSKYDEVTTIKKIDETSADYLHIDLMDGRFVENKNYTVSQINSFVKHTTKLLDVHLMTMNPEKYIEKFALLNTKCITFHLEAVDNPDEVIDLIHSYGINAGISIKPNTSIDELKPYLEKIEHVLIMTVEPGEGGQQFMMDMVKKVDELNNLGDFTIAVDGGINADTIKYVKNADIAISGSFVCESSDYEARINELRG